MQPDDYRVVEDCAHIDPDHGLWSDLDCSIDDWYDTGVNDICASTICASTVD